MIKKVFIVHHSHTDIGYTDIQTKVFEDHVKFIDDVLDYCQRTDNYPEESKFRWTCEVSWTVKNYFENRPDKIHEFIKRVKEGRIEVTGLYLNVTELYTAEELIRSLYFAKDLEKRYGIKVISAMNCDIPGISWIIPQILSKSGIRYLSMATNEIRAFAPSVPRPFYWLSPDGSKVLVWNAGREGFYDEGNFLGFNKSYHEVSELLPPYLEKQEMKGYPFDAIRLQSAHDNVSPYLELSSIVREWNKKHKFPEIIISTNSEFFQYIEKTYKDKIPSYKLAWPDWWADGFGTAAYETGLSRNAHRKLIILEKIASILSLLGENYPKKEIEKAWDDISFFDEHTWGARGAIDSPHSVETKAHWINKSFFLYRPSVEIKRFLKDNFSIFASKIKNLNKERIVLFNLLPERRDDLVRFRLPKWKWQKGNQIKDEDKLLPYQIEEGITPLDPFEPGKGWVEISFFAKKIPSFGYKTLNIISGKPKFKSNFLFRKELLESKFYKIILDPITGGIKSIIDKGLNKELIDQNSFYKFNQYIYEEIVSKRGREDIWKEPSPLWAPEGKRKDARFRRISPESCSIRKGKDGPVMGSLIIETKAKGCPKIIQEVILYNDLKRIDIVNTLLKEETLNPEGVYYAFPFNFKKPEIRFEISGAVMQPEVDQLPYTAKDYYSIQDWLSISDKDHSIVLVTKEAPLVQFGEINTGKWITDKLKIENGAIFSWIMNNYWYTNFRASQGREISFHYSITSAKGKIGDSKAHLFARQCNNPVIAFPISQNLKGTLPEKEWSFLSLDKKNISLLALKKSRDNKGIVIRLQEIRGKDTNLKVTIPGLKISKAWITNIVERNIRSLKVQNNTISVSTEGFGITTIRAEFR